jgi:hypothetical protein
MFRLLLMIVAVAAKLQVLAPSDLVQSIDDASRDPSNNGTITYSVSLFGKIIYDEQFIVDVLVPDDSAFQFGCSPLPVPTSEDKRLFVWVVARGNCTFTAKAYNAQRTGAFAVVVYNDDPNQDVTNLIALNDNACSLKSLDNQHPGDPDRWAGRKGDRSERFGQTERQNGNRFSAGCLIRLPRRCRRLGWRSG